MSLRTTVGAIRNLLDETPEHCRRVAMPTPVLQNGELAKLRTLDARPVPDRDAVDAVPGRGRRRPASSGRSTRSAARRRGWSGTATTILILSDRGVDRGRTRRSRRCSRPPPSTPTSCARARARCAASSSSRASRARRCTSRSCSATAPRPSTRTSRSSRCAALHADGELGDADARRGPRAVRGRRSASRCSRSAPRWASRRCRATAAPRSSRPSGSGAGSSTATSPAPSPASAGSSCPTSHDEIAERHAAAFPPGRGRPSPELDPGGEYQQRRRGEHHAWNPDTIVRLQRAVRDDAYATFTRVRRGDRRVDRGCRRCAACSRSCRRPSRSRSRRSSRRPRSCAASRPAR